MSFLSERDGICWQTNMNVTNRLYHIMIESTRDIHFSVALQDYDRVISINLNNVDAYSQKL